MLSIQHRNDTASNVRGVFIQGGLVALVTRYHKGFAFSGRPKTVYRFLPNDVGELLVYYLWLIAPVEAFFIWLTQGRITQSVFLWQHKPDSGGVGPHDVEGDTHESEEEVEEEDDHTTSRPEEAEGSTEQGGACTTDTSKWSTPS